MVNSFQQNVGNGSYFISKMVFDFLTLRANVIDICNRGPVGWKLLIDSSKALFDTSNSFILEICFNWQQVLVLSYQTKSLAHLFPEILF